MKVSLKWLQGYFDAPLPELGTITDALTFHAFEIEEAAGDLLDVKVLPDRASYALSHRGIARELSAVLDLPLSRDPLRTELPAYPAADLLEVAIEDSGKCLRYMSALVRGVTVGPSPAWLKEALESVGQRSINNVVDATNYVMLDVGQPLHAFDAGKLTAREGKYAIAVRGAREGEPITSLSGDAYQLPGGTLIIEDANAGRPIGIAGVKGGDAAEITEATTDIIIESANFEGTLVRHAAQSLKLWTDASLRFQNRLSPALASVGMRDVLAMIRDIANGEVVDVVDVNPASLSVSPVSVPLSRINGLLGSRFTLDEVKSAYDRLGLSYTEVEETFTVLPPIERQDLLIPEDLVEEAGRILGYDRIESAELPPLERIPDQERFRGIEAVRDFLIERGYSEVSTPSFSKEGEIELENPLASDKPYLRPSLLPNMRDALERGRSVAPRLVGTVPVLKLFEIGTVFTKSEESLFLSMGVIDLAGKQAASIIKENAATLEQELLGVPGACRFSLDGQMLEVNLSKLNLEKLGSEYAPVTVALEPYQPFSLYPFALRDIAAWTPAGTSESEAANAIIGSAGELLARIDLFDRFEKEGRISYAFRLVFESKERTLADTDLDPAMQRITETLDAKEGWQVR